MKGDGVCEIGNHSALEHGLVFPPSPNVRIHLPLKRRDEGFPGGSVVKNLPANARDTGWIPDLGGSHMPRSN